MELPVAVASKPNVITVWLAVNDLADGIPLASYQVELRQLLVSLHDRTRARIFVGNIPDLTLLPHFFTYDPAALTTQVDKWNTSIASICNQVGVSLVDIHSAWKSLVDHPDYISSDGFHPSTEGARQLAQLFFSSIETASAG
jgi:lysophospholipase L1-like esterase